MEEDQRYVHQYANYRIPLITSQSKTRPRRGKRKKTVKLHSELRRKKLRLAERKSSGRVARRRERKLPSSLAEPRLER